MTIYDFLKRRNIHIKNKVLMEIAFTHSSYVNEHKGRLKDNERLEFVGDAVLQIYSADLLFRQDPPLSEGKMTTFRASLVCEKALAEYVLEYHLNDYLKLGLGEEKNGGRTRPSIMADMFEAFIGALYLDQGYDVAKGLLDEIIPHHLDDYRNDIDYKTTLQEYIQMDSRKSLEYELLSSEGPSNNPTFEVAVKVDDIILGIGKASSKKEAQKLAAKDALDKLAL
ncbi:MAG: ribonuclease III [Erysipelotrichaceae bacterium]|nr:ribonuclease III [Erysipelotrichaceae bacterium]